MLGGFDAHHAEKLAALLYPRNYTDLTVRIFPLIFPGAFLQCLVGRWIRRNGDLIYLKDAGSDRQLQMYGFFDCSRCRIHFTPNNQVVRDCGL